MSGAVSILHRAPGNPATRPELTESLKTAVAAKTGAALRLLRDIGEELGRQG